ncbi:hypothetical protein [Nocardioides sp. R-C-SC26]|uniref:hypothetical protein n=1 Tax=Nocardioides sp. R-C-SC26 TaxID=2870414 RepID=UPI001E5EFACB|nr:hypothetical protein [Nocardioides sp. R-C-SC26]
MLLGVLLAVVVSLALGATAGSAADPLARAITPAAKAAPAGKDGFSTTKTLTRTFAEADGQTTTVASYDVTVRADRTQNLRGRQRVRITWSGAQPSGGRASNPYGENGLAQEYPVVVMQCRGRDGAGVPAARQLRPETCWTASVAQRSQVLRSDGEALWRVDRFEDEADRERVSGIDPFPAEQCADADVESYSTHLTEFAAAGGTVFPACDSESMPPEAAVGAAFPPAEVAAYTDENGAGSVKFEVRSDVENESLGCSHTVECSIVVVPIVGLSCDTPSTPISIADRACRKLGRFAPGSSNFANEGVDQAVSPALWWSESNWRNRFSIPITFGLPPDTCDVLDTRPPTGFYGSELLAQAALQWSPAYCLDTKRFKFQLNQMPDEAGWNLMTSGEGPAAVVSSEHTALAGQPIGYAPTAVTGFAVGYVIDRPENGGEYTQLKLTPRLLAKLLTQSYVGSDLGRGHPGMAGNPVSILNDPEFVELNPGLSRIDQEAGATLLSLSTSADVVEQLTSYIAQNREASAFVAGKADPWGMVVNPSYRKIELPRAEWPLLDTYVPQTQNSCRQANPAVYFNQLAAPVTTLRKIAEALLDSHPNVQTRCDYDASTQQYKVGRIDRQSFGARFLLGIVSLGDAERYGLRAAALQTKPGRFVPPTAQSLANAVDLTTQKRTRLPFVLDQADVARSGGAYPGTMVVYTAAKLSGLDAETAGHLAQFVRVSTTEGQRPGSGNGELPAGFLPIRDTGPTAKLLDAADDVADAIEAQRPPKTSPPAGPGGGDGGPDSSDGGTTPPGDLTPPGRSTPDTTPPTGAPTQDPVLTASPTAATTTVDSGIAGRLLPGLLALGLLAGVYSAASRFFVRVPRRPEAGGR